MKKQLRNIIISFCVVAVLGLGIFLLAKFVPTNSSSSSSVTSSSTPTLTVYKTDSTKITSVQVKNATGGYTIRQSGGNFTLDGIKNVPLTQTALSSAVTAASDVTASELIQTNDSNLAQYGLDKPKIVITVTSTGGTTSVIDVGNEAPAADGYYVKLANKTDVYKSTDTSIHDTFAGTAIDYVDTTITALDTSKLTEMTSIFFGGSSRTAPIVLNEDQSGAAAAASSDTAPPYLMVSPHTYGVDPDKITTVTTAIQALSAASTLSLDVSSANLAKYGLNNPKYTFGFTFDGKKTTIDVGTPYVDSGTTYLPIILEGTPVIYSIGETTIPFYNWQLTDICTGILFSEYIDTVKTITVTTGNESYTINLTGSDSSLSGTYGTKKLVTSNIRLFYETLVGMNFEGQAAQPKNGSVYAHVEVDYHNTAKAPTKMDFTTIDSQKYFWSINGNGEFYVLKSQIDIMLKAVRDLTAGKTVVLAE
jgi:hypothetical protein